MIGLSILPYDNKKGAGLQKQTGPRLSHTPANPVRLVLWDAIKHLAAQTPYANRSPEDPGCQFHGFHAVRLDQTCRPFLHGNPEVLGEVGPQLIEEPVRHGDRMGHLVQDDPVQEAGRKILRDPDPPGCRIGRGQPVQPRPIHQTIIVARLPADFPEVAADDDGVERYMPIMERSSCARCSFS